MNSITVEVTDSIRVKVIPDEIFDFLMSNREVGLAFGLEESTIRSYKGKRWKDKLEEGVHTTERKVLGKGGLQATNLLTKNGVVKLAQLLGGQEAKRVELWAQEYSTKKQINEIANNDSLKTIVNGMLKVMLKYEVQQGARNEMLAWIEKLEALKIEEK